MLSAKALKVFLKASLSKLGVVRKAFIVRIVERGGEWSGGVDDSDRALKVLMSFWMTRIGTSR